MSLAICSKFRAFQRLLNTCAEVPFSRLFQSVGSALAQTQSSSTDGSAVFASASPGLDAALGLRLAISIANVRHICGASGPNPSSISGVSTPRPSASSTTDVATPGLRASTSRAYFDDSAFDTSSMRARFMSSCRSSVPAVG